MLTAAGGAVRRSARSLRARRSARGPTARDIELALLFAVLGFVPTLSVIGAQIGDLGPRPADAGHVVLTLAQCLPLAVRSRWPAVGLVVVAGAFCLHQALGYPQTFASLGLYVALYSAGSRHERHRVALPVALSAGYAVLAVVLHVLGSPQQVLDFLAFFLALVAMWAAGAWMRDRRANEAERRRLAAQVARTAERARISRELHDVVTHHVTAAVVQADAAQFHLADSARVAESFTAIGDTGRRALTELRALLTVLQTAEDPEAAVVAGSLDELVARARLAGQPVELVIDGEPAGSAPDVRLAAHRVVQEGLTNALKYAPGRPTRVRVHHGADRVDVEVRTQGPPPGAAPATAPVGREASGGRGLAGLRDRVAALGGSLVAGARPDGGFAVRADIPARSRV